MQFSDSNNMISLCPYHWYLSLISYIKQYKLLSTSILLILLYTLIYNQYISILNNDNRLYNKSNINKSQLNNTNNNISYMSYDELSTYNGIKHKSIYIGCNKYVLNVTLSTSLYDPYKGRYKQWCGKDISRNLAIGSFIYDSNKLDDLDNDQINHMIEWCNKLKKKYKVVALLNKE